MHFDESCLTSAVMNRAGQTLFLASGQLNRMFQSSLEPSSDSLESVPKICSQLASLENVKEMDSPSPEIVYNIQ